MADDKRKKKRGRSKGFRFCFRSSAADEASSSVNKSDGLETKNGRLGKPVLTGKELLPDGKMVNGGVADSGGDCVVQRPSRRRRFSRVLKAVLFDSMKTKKKKIRRSSSKPSIASDTSESSSLSSEKIGKSFEDINACSKECADLDDSCSHSNLFSSSSRTTLSSASTSSSSSINSNSRWSSDQKSSSRLDSVDNRDSVPSNSSISNKSNRINSTSRSSFEQKVSSATDTPIISISRPSSYQKELSRLDSRTSVSSKSDKIKSGSKNGSIRWCLFLLLSLIVLVIWGRLFSILWTSISFYFVPRPRLKRVNSVPTTTEFLDFDSDQYKKKVIMAGLLDRTRPIR